MKEFGPKLHIANPRLCDFSVPKELYNFRSRSVVPDLSNLRKPLQVDWDMARRLFVGSPQLSNVEFDLEKARKLFVPNLPWGNEEEDDEEQDDDDEEWDDVEDYWD